MLKVEWDVNGRVIGRVGIHNTGVKRLLDDGSTQTKYDVYRLGREWARTEGLQSEGATKLGEVWHARDERAARLTAKVMRKFDASEIFDDEL